MHPIRKAASDYDNTVTHVDLLWVGDPEMRPYKIKCDKAQDEKCRPSKDRSSYHCDVLAERIYVRCISLHAQDRPQSLRAASNTVCSVGTVTSSKGGENGIGTCIAPMRLTGASIS